MGGHLNGSRIASRLNLIGAATLAITLEGNATAAKALDDFARDRQNSDMGYADLDNAVLWEQAQEKLGNATDSYAQFETLDESTNE